MACPQKAVMAIAGRFCIDFDLCKNCGKCIIDCPTGACDCYIETAKAFSVDDQSNWEEIPS